MPICSLSKRSLLPSLTVILYQFVTAYLFVLKTNSKMLQQFKILLLALIFRRVLSNYEDYSIDSTTRDDSCTEPNETGTESNCYCYSQPETEFEYSICAPKQCPLDDACCIGGYKVRSEMNAPL